jgi:uncharacterized delta-60 repeat protein
MRRISIPAVLLALAAWTLHASSSFAAGVLRAPGRVVVRDPRIQKDPDAGGSPLTVMLPSGDVVFVGDPDGRGLAFQRLRRDGTLDPSYIRLPPLPGRLHGFGLVRAPDGRMILVLEGTPRSSNEFSSLLVMRFGADGALDRTYGQDGVAASGINLGCGGACEDAAVAADGSVLLTGTTGGASEAPTDPTAPGHYRWVVTRLKPNGAVDTSFGTNGVATLGPEPAEGFNVAPLPDGRVVAEGQAGGAGDSHILLARLTVSGSLDPSFNGGSVVTTPFATGFPWAVHQDGQVDIEGAPPGTPGLVPHGSAASHARIARYTAAGALDTSFGVSGVADLGSVGISTLLAEPAGRLLALGYPTAPNNLSGGPTLAAVRVTPSGTIDPSLGGPSGVRKTLHFGGGIHGGPLRQNSFGTFARALRRPDSSIVIPGGVSLVRYTGEGEGYSTGASAFASLTPEFALEAGFGGARTLPRISVRIPRQSAAAVNRRRRLSVVLKPSAPSLCEVRIGAGGRRIAKKVIAMFSERRRRWTLPTRVALRRGARLTVTVRVRDMIGTEAGARRHARLR